MRAASLLAVVLGSVGASAEEPSPPPTLSASDLEIERARENYAKAREHYEQAARSYERGQYEAALKSFEASYALLPQPDLHFNIGRCHERLGKWDAAATAYEKFLAAKPDEKDAVEVRERIADLRVRAREANRPAPTTPPPRPSYRAPAIALLATALVLGATGLGVMLSPLDEYNQRRAACAGRCAPETLDGLRTRVEIAQATGGALLALAGAALVADIVMWVYDAKSRREPRRVSARATGVEVRF
jgi:tetratricopeptide (TPR) repeat protein